MSFITRHSPSSLNLFCASPAMFILEKVVGVRQQVGAPAHRGVGVEEGVTLGLLNPDAPLSDCLDAAFRGAANIAFGEFSPARQLGSLDRPGVEE